MTSYCSDMCIVCFAPKRTDFHSLFICHEKSVGPSLSELGEFYQELMQVKLSMEERRPQFVCGYCKTRLSLFHQFKMKALEAYKKVSSENGKGSDSADSQTSENLVKVEQITVYDASTKQTEKYEIQYLNEEDEVCETEIQDNSYFSSSEANSCDSNGPGATNLLVVKCTICLKSFENNETFTHHLKEHGEIPEYSLKKPRRLMSAADRVFGARIQPLATGAPTAVPGPSAIQVPATTLTKRKRCFFCGIRKDRKTQKACCLCAKPVCPEHSTIVCQYCIFSYACDQCQQKFHSKENFVNHIKIHDKNVRGCHCTLCGKVFTKPGHLKSHMQTHRDERPFDCKVCFKRFRSTSHLRYHSYSHEGKTFECRVCKGLYSTPRTLIYHMNVVHKRCDVCDETFGRRDELNAHKLLHKSPDCLLTTTICID